MKKIILLLGLVFITLSVSAQNKYAYIYSQKIFDTLPAYKTALSEINTFAKNARANVDAEIKKAKVLFDQYNQIQSRMDQAFVERYKQMIIDQEKAANEMEEKYFGMNGEIEQKQKALMQPIEKMVLDAVSKISTAEGYGMVFDLSLVKVTIYEAPSLNITDKVIKALGY